jgi:DNA-binding LacI/PurR family transcriptional regulator
MLPRRIDGLFIHPVYRFAPTSSIFDELLKGRTPTVLLGHHSPFCASFPSVETDDAAASCQMTEHFLRLGHRRIAFFAGPPAAPWAQERFEGYRRALRNAQLPLEDRLIFGAGLTIEDGQKAAEQMLNESADATAVQTVSDLVAIGVARTLGRRGLKIPDDISLAGFGNYLVGEHFHIPLSTVQLPRQEVGHAAVQTMQRLLRGEKPESRRLGAELILRGSTSPPHSAAASTVHEPAMAAGSDFQEDDLQ